MADIRKFGDTWINLDSILYANEKADGSVQIRFGLAQHTTSGRTPPDFLDLKGDDAKVFKSLFPVAVQPVP